MFLFLLLLGLLLAALHALVFATPVPLCALALSPIMHVLPTLPHLGFILQTTEGVLFMHIRVVAHSWPVASSQHVVWKDPCVSRFFLRPGLQFPQSGVLPGCWHLESCSRPTI